MLANHVTRRHGVGLHLVPYCAAWALYLTPSDLLVGAPVSAKEPLVPRRERHAPPPATADHTHTHTQHLRTYHLVLDQRMFLWASYVVCGMCGMWYDRT
jgi:hypothetical protein